MRPTEPTSAGRSVISLWERIASSSINKILGNSESIKAVKSLIRQVAPSTITVLITGESGTGKELVARAIHDLSLQKNGSLITVNCGAIPEGIFESEIFGHEKGSFTSAEQRRRGYFEMADKGTLFLDEIGEMPLQVQVKLLRVLETGTFLRVGGSSEIKVDTRVIAATNKDLITEVGRGRFRQDLYYRLKAVTINVSPLRERTEDVPVLAEHFAKDFAQRNKRQAVFFTHDAIERLKNNYWEGNVRELRNIVESIIALHQNSEIGSDLVDKYLVRTEPVSNLPMVVNKSPEDMDRDLIYRTLLDLRHELDVIKGMVQQSLILGSKEVKYPFESAVEVDAYDVNQPDRNPNERNRMERLKHRKSTDNAIECNSLAELEKEQIKRTLNEMEGNRRLTADALGIGERTLYRKLKQYNLK